MKDGLLELQMTIPAFQMETSLKSSLKNTNGFILQLETALNMPETTSVQKAILRYGNKTLIVNAVLESFNPHWVLNNFVDYFADNNKVELEMKSDTNTEVEKLFPNLEVYRSQLQASIDAMLDQKVTKTDMKLRHIVSKGLEVRVTN